MEQLLSHFYIMFDLWFEIIFKNNKIFPESWNIPIFNHQYKINIGQNIKFKYRLNDNWLNKKELMVQKITQKINKLAKWRIFGVHKPLINKIEKYIHYTRTKAKKKSLKKYKNRQIHWGLDIVWISQERERL